jgi:HlyD family secretion protein
MKFIRTSAGRPPSILAKAYLLAVIVVMAAGLLLAGCQRTPDPAATTQRPDKGAEPAAPKLSVVRPERKTVRRWIKRPGYNIESYQSTPLYSKISGYVLKWNFDIGDSVEKNTVMAELWVPEMEVDVERQEALVKQAQAEIQQARAAKLRAKAEERRTKSQYERLVKVGNSVIAQESVDENRYGFEAAQAAVAKAEADVATATARLQVAEKSRDYARTLLKYAKIRAPFNGVVTRRMVNDRDFVQPPAGKKSEPLFVVDQVDPVRVFVNVPELDAVWITNGSTVTIRTQSLPGREFQGAVTRTARSLDPATRTLRTEIDLHNADRELLPGMYVDVNLQLERRNVWTLPSSAVIIGEDAAYCYRLENGKAVRTLLRIGLQADKTVEVLQKESRRTPDAKATWESLTGDERILTGNLSAVQDGQEVSVP